MLVSRCFYWTLNNTNKVAKPLSWSSILYFYHFFCIIKLRKFDLFYTSLSRCRIRWSCWQTSVERFLSQIIAGQHSGTNVLIWAGVSVHKGWFGIYIYRYNLYHINYILLKYCPYLNHPCLKYTCNRIIVFRFHISLSFWSNIYNL